MALKISNTLTRSKEKFIPIDEKNIRMYVCGPTVYDYPHVGNARPLIVFDLLFRLLSKIYPNSKVTYVRNITDIDDKIIEASNKSKISIQDLTSKVTKDFHDDCNYLGCLNPTIEPKATEHLNEMINLIKKLIQNDFAYESNGHVYFQVTKFKKYGNLSNKKIEELISGSRVEVSDNKKEPGDFVLWKPSKENEPSWDSPFGKGRPGWHLECSAMSEKYLGNHFDIHGGGLDLIFPHHENEIAQSCCNNSTQKFSNYWVHNGFVTIDKEKMSKSLGNIVTISDAVKKYSGQVVRLALLSAHYSQPLDWNEKLLLEQKSTIEKWYQLYEDSDEELETEVIESLLEDLNTPGFIAKIHELYNSAIKGDEKSKKNFNSACRLIGLFNQSKNEWDKFKKSKSNVSEEFILNKINERLNAKNNGNYKLADQIRDELLKKDVVIEDQKDKTIWKFK